jgi:hypothetical protein
MTGDPELPRPATVEFGPPGEPWRRPWLLPVAGALAVGLALGFLLGQRHRPAPAVVAPSASAPAESEVNPIVRTGHTCAITVAAPGGRNDLWLGAEIRNRSARSLTIEAPGVELPLGGLSLVGPPSVTTCGELPGAAATGVLGPGASTWISARLRVAGTGCPAALPVLFAVGFRAGAEHDSALVGGFNDLGAVPYPACTP